MVTSLGFPEPPDTGLLADCAKRDRALAAAVDALLVARLPRVGVATGSPPAGATADVTVTFTPAFAVGAVPRVALGLNHPFVDTYRTSVTNVTRTGCTIRIYSPGGAGVNIPVHYIASI